MKRIDLPEAPPYGAVEALEAAGIAVRRIAGVWHADDADAAAAIIAAHDPLPAARAAKLAEIAAYRYARETGGADIMGMRIDTSREARNNLTGAVVTSQLAGPAFAVQWKGLSGRFATLRAAEMAALGVAVAEHVSACFAREAALAAEIEALGTVEDVLAFDIGARWPA